MASFGATREDLLRYKTLILSGIMAVPTNTDYFVVDGDLYYWSAGNWVQKPDVNNEVGGKVPLLVTPDQATAFQSLVSGGILVAAPAGAICVAPDGSDSNSGTEAAPLRTIAAAVALLTAGATVALKRGGVWRETFQSLTLNNVRLTSYGSMQDPLPCLDCADMVAPYLWTKTAGRTNVYQVSWAHVISGGYTQVWENGAQLLPVADQATCDSTPGSFVVAGVQNGPATVTIFINATGSTDPRTNARVYEISRRGMGVDFGYTNATTIDGIWVARPAANQGGMQALTLRNVLVSESAKHTVWTNVGGSCTNAVAYKFTNAAVAGYTSGQSFITYSTTDLPSAITNHTNLWHYDPDLRFTSMCYSHSNGVANIGTRNYSGLYCYGATTVIGGLNGVAINYDTVYAERTGGVSGIGDASVGTNITWVCNSPDGGPNAGSPSGFNGAGVFTVSDLRVYIEGTRSLALVNGPTAGSIITNATVVSGDTGYKVCITSTASGQNCKLSRSVFVGCNQFFNMAAGADARAGTDYNVYWNNGGSVHWALNGTSYTSLAAYKAARTDLDQNSISSDPLFIGNAEYGEFGFAANSPANFSASIRAGSRRYIRRPNWAALSRAWARGFLGIDGVMPPAT